MTEAPPFTMDDRTYNKLRWMSISVLPAAGTLYFALSTIWGWPNGDAVLGSVVALQAFLGIVLGVSSKAYDKSEARYDGDMLVHKDEEGDAVGFHMALNGDPADLKDKKEVIFKIKAAPKKKAPARD